MNQRQIEHWSQQVVQALHEIEHADNGRVRLSHCQSLIRGIESKVHAIQQVNWDRADELQELLTHVCLDERSL